MIKSLTINYLRNIFIVLSIIMILLPQLWFLLWSFKSIKDIISLNFFSEFSIENYIHVLTSKEESIVKGLTDSFILAMLSILTIIPLTLPTSYGLIRFKISKWFKWFILNIFMFIRALPGTAIVVPFLPLSISFGLYDTYFIVLLMYILKFSPLALFMLMTFIGEIPIEIEEAARIDGSSTLTLFRKIVIPLIAPGIAATAVFIMIYAWSDYIFVLFLTARNVTNIQIAIAQFNSEYYVKWGQLLAGTVISVIPVIVITALTQKSMIKGLTLGAIKR